MMFPANPHRRPTIWHASTSLRLFLALLVGTATLAAASCSGDVQDKRPTSSSTSSSTSSTSSGEGGAASGGGGMGGNSGVGGSGGMGTGGNPVDGGTGTVEYLGYNLFTHVPRFIILKVDHTRNLCFRIWMEGFIGPGPLTIDVTAPWAASHAEVTNNVADCVMVMGFPPQPVTFSNATSGMGKIVVNGGFPCAVDVHATLAFDPSAPWVPMSEAFDVDQLNIEGGCN